MNGSGIERVWTARSARLNTSARRPQNESAATGEYSLEPTLPRRRGGSTVASRVTDGEKQNQNRFAKKLDVSVCVVMPHGREALKATGTTGPS